MKELEMHCRISLLFKEWFGITNALIFTVLDYSHIFPLIMHLTPPVRCLWFLWFQILILQGLKQEVTCLCPSPDGLHLAVGYEDGSIRIFSLLSGEGNVTFNGHKAAITSLKYDQLGGRLASGSKVRPWIRCPDFNLVKEYKTYAEAGCSQKLLGESVGLWCTKPYRWWKWREEGEYELGGSFSCLSIKPVKYRNKMRMPLISIM